MKTLFVTGRLASEMLKRVLHESGLNPSEYDVLVADIDVAAFMTASYVKRVLESRRDLLRGFDLVVVPGFTRGDLSQVARELGVSIVKGPRFLQDIPLFIKALREGVRFSPVDPADTLLEGYRSLRERDLVRRVEESSWESRVFTIGSGPTAKPVSRVRPLVVAEVSNAVELSEEEAVATAKRFVESGADVVVVGGEAGEDRPEKIGSILRRLRGGLGVPVGVDAYHPSEVEVALKEGVDLVFVSNEEVLRLVKLLVPCDTAIVVTPAALKPGGQTPIEGLGGLVSELRREGFAKVIADPVLHPPLMGLLESIKSYIDFRERFPDTPLMMGVGNVTEFIDADCHGVNAILASIAVELGVELLLTTEGSTKTRGCVGELVKAARLASMARYEGKPPKDYSVNLLYLKSKRSREVKGTLPEDAVRVELLEPVRLDPRGFFKVWVDRGLGCIVVEHYKTGESRPDHVFCGSEPVSIGREIARRGLIELLDHAVYLGSELQKAWIALKTGKDYVQDEDLF
ncbi:dihydropteroate synthase-related protein [Thermogladius calderae 1633]|uniref:Dihydropteroate synthase-related protein n=1 Tax=Thermogladius calderae (strain DSM 22663 / VKM B-2946 / 1633) TaxID=1184251 RepID=I3TES5_THEC1|nr:dihydropteroate synthase-like protein [Thermogladius calderae]AFK51263.1 dihydropteroate synthase-related protein [Thermogladius calderae 1633]